MLITRFPHTNIHIPIHKINFPTNKYLHLKIIYFCLWNLPSNTLSKFKYKVFRRSFLFPLIFNQSRQRFIVPLSIRPFYYRNCLFKSFQINYLSVCSNKTISEWVSRWNRGRPNFTLILIEVFIDGALEIAQAFYFVYFRIFMLVHNNHFVVYFKLFLS